MYIGSHSNHLPLQIEILQSNTLLTLWFSILLEQYYKHNKYFVDKTRLFHYKRNWKNRSSPKVFIVLETRGGCGSGTKKRQRHVMSRDSTSISPSTWVQWSARACRRECPRVTFAWGRKVKVEVNKSCVVEQGSLTKHAFKAVGTRRTRNSTIGTYQRGIRIKMANEMGQCGFAYIGFVLFVR